MKTSVSTQQMTLLAVLSIFCVLFSAGFFTPEERYYPGPTAFIEGATPPSIITWEMY